MRGFKMASLNIASLPRHIDELRIWLNDQNVDILAINETRLDSTIPDESVKISNYEIIRKDRNRFGGGVCMYVRNSINYVNKSSMVTSETEAICLEIRKSQSKPFTIISCYRPPNYEAKVFFKNLEQIVNGLEFGNNELYILGDLNCNMLLTDGSAPNAQLNALCELYQLEQLIKDPTRITMNTRTLIDIVLTNKPQRIISSGVIHLSISDHSLVYAIRTISVTHKTTHTITEIRNFKNFNVESFNDELERTPWRSVNNHCDPNLMWDCWKTMFLDIVDKHAPIKKKRIKNKKSPWLTASIKKSMINRDKLKSAAIKTNTAEDWLNYKNLKNRLNNEIKKTKTRYYQENFRSNTGKPREIWKSINEIMSRNTKNDSKINSIKTDAGSTTSPEVMSEAFNKYFTEIGSNLAYQLPKSTKSYSDFINPVNSRFQLELISSPKVLKLLNNLSANKATGIDKIPCCLVKLAAPYIADSLCDIFNSSIRLGIFPSDWKIAKIIPIYKGDEKDELGNYRPISILSPISKVFERLIYDQLYEYLSVNNLLSESQSGFRRFHSTMTTLLDATTEWYENMDKGKLNCVVFLDLSKAFDTVNHTILLDKLARYGLQPETVNWFSSFLTDRKQQCLVDGHLSSPRKIQCGVPQGSILGPLLFLIYINDLPSCLKYSKARMFADDTTVTTADKSIIKMIQNANSDLANLREWLLANKLSLNLGKTEQMFIASDDNLNKICDSASIYLANKPLRKVRKSKSLGIFIDERLSWSVHIDTVAKKVSSAIGGLRQIRHLVNKKTAITIYNALIRSLFDYCDLVWDSVNLTLAKRLQKLNNRAGRVISQLGYDVRSNDIRNQLGWTTLAERRAEHKCILMYKILRAEAPIYLKQLFPHVSNDEEYYLGDRKINLILPKAKTEYMKKSFKFSASKLWNSLPLETKLQNTLSSFKRSLPLSVPL